MIMLKDIDLSPPQETEDWEKTGKLRHTTEYGPSLDLLSAECLFLSHEDKT